MFAPFNKLVDFHTHCFPDKIANATVFALHNNSGAIPHTDGTLDGLLNNLQNANGTIAVNLPVLTKPTQFESVAKFAIEINKRFADSSVKVISFGGMHPACENIEEKMQFLKDNGIKGVKIHPDYQETFIDDDGYIIILEMAKKLDMIVVTHSGVDDGYKDKPVLCTPDRVLKVIEKVNHNKFVLGHYGAHRQWEEVYDKLAGKDVYFDTAFTFGSIDKELFLKILEKHGEDKVLFATDCPWHDINADKLALLSFGLSRETLEKIAYKNACKLLNISL